MSKNNKYNEPIPKGYRIYFGDLEVAGIKHRIDAFESALSGRFLGLQMYHDKRNKHDKNAIEIYMRVKGWFFTKSYHIGFVPKDVAKQVAELGCYDDIQPRLRSVWLGDRGGARASFDLLGLKTEYAKYFKR